MVKQKSLSSGCVVDVVDGAAVVAGVVGAGVGDVDGGSCHAGVATGESLLDDDVDVVGNSRWCRRGMQAMVGADVIRISGTCNVDVDHGVSGGAAGALVVDAVDLQEPGVVGGRC